MEIDQLKEVVEVAVSKSSGMKLWQILLLVIASAIAAFFGAYLKEKAKST
ncbi:MAG: hypothetical protein GY808_03295, partial [Gammaproteobacteria bacterium]|nr:hypothetical protein [Gammaproteobacteria bacterium]